MPSDIPAVVVVLLFLLCCGAYLLTRPPESTLQVRVVHAQITNFTSALSMYKSDNGSFPAGANGLNDLIVKPTNAPPDWRQYMDHVPLDPWGHPYLYLSPGLHNTNSFDLSSAGPDGIPGTQDDITNWQ